MMITGFRLPKLSHNTSFGLGLAVATLSLLPSAGAQSVANDLAPAVVVAAATATAAPSYATENGIAVLGPRPMLDEGGNQRLDPEGKPMFLPAVLQQRDRKGHPVFDAAGRPVFQTETDPGYDEHGRKIKVEKEKPAKPLSFEVADGTFMVNRLPVIRGISYQVVDQQYIYIYAPGFGVAVVSQTPFPGAVEQKGALTAKSIAIHVEGRTLEIASEKPLHGKWSGNASAWVLLDRYHKLPNRKPVIGFGSVASAPYAWPGSTLQPGGLRQTASATMAPPPGGN